MHTRLALIATAIAGLTSGAAFAADLPLRSAPPAFVAPLPIFTWTGAYFGINAGAVFDADTRYRTTGATAGNQAAITGNFRPGQYRTQDSGFTAGGTIGYNYQFGVGNGLVIGIEADAAYTDLSKTANNFALIGGATYLTQYRSGLDYLGTVRGRIGYAYNQFLIYGTGGFAYGGVNSRHTLFAADGTGIFTGSRSSTETGYAYGGGVEYALPTGSFLNFFHSSAVTIKAEYLHYDLGSRTLAVNAINTGIGQFNSRVRADGDIARVGLNYKF
ncbi:porin family protein [Lichenihabitans sp. PAMC28606]|uniref:outer membrane protein n=1 Tax=Lichenihabitans sp. PAMC28606 TaxID=2880932 RepID=UPI001D09B3DE|nr:porin family protein [Lichenihabitans sp. PAMC28606]UDL93328.1 porin family protein [Lichenihabitans sp. PAMC28606]